MKISIKKKLLFGFRKIPLNHKPKLLYQRSVKIILINMELPGRRERRVRPGTARQKDFMNGHRNCLLMMT